MRRLRKKNKVPNKTLVAFLQSRNGALRTEQPLIENGRTFGFICVENKPDGRRCIFINKKSSLNGVVSVGERVVTMSRLQNISIIIGLDKKYYKVSARDIDLAYGVFKNTFKNVTMVNFSLHKAKAWDVTVIGKFFPLVADNQPELGEQEREDEKDVEGRSETVGEKQLSIANEQLPMESGEKKLGEGRCEMVEERTEVVMSETINE